MRREKDAIRRAIQRAVEGPRTRVERRSVSPMLEGLRNASRSAERALDEAGVPDEFQGLTQDEVDELREDDDFFRDWQSEKDW